MRKTIAYVVFFFVLLVSSAYLKCSNYTECREHGFSVEYCLTSGGR